MFLICKNLGVLHQNDLCQVLLDLEKKIFNILSTYFLYFVMIYPGKGVALHLKLKSRPKKDALCIVWLNLAQKRRECELFTDRQTDGRRLNLQRNPKH